MSSVSSWPMEMPPTERASLPTRWARAMGGSMLSFLFSIVAWTIIFSVFITGVSTVIIWVGIPIIAASFGLAHLYAQAKRKMATWMGAQPWEDLPPVPRPKGWWNRIKGLFTSPEHWREMAYGLVGSFIDWTLAVFSLAWVGAGLMEIVSAVVPEAQGIVGSIAATEWPSIGFPGFMTMVPLWARLADVGVGVALLILWIPIAWICARGQVGLTRAFLAPSRRAMQTRLARVEQAKTSAEQAEAQSLARVERDLHDGAQQSLIRQGMDLATAERRLADNDVDSARRILADARARNDETLAQVRAVSTGVASPILAEKGLGEAVVSLAAMSPIPVTVAVDLDGSRLPEPVERAVYFTISEGLANIAKHSGATSASVTVGRSSLGLQAEISDNGKGGAQSLPGHGLSGLASRLAAVSGSLVIDSVPGEGTRLLIDVPLS